ncbi:hypothetical protein GCM10011591_41980 [Nocardia camponoti]|uniref:DUF72 domain-containing protein n=2 Tax=Nocardia camponoti TaxID=1616106 RepID=A0A917QRX9_9NOCA|nr:hypothetical protein GCM10011591_41980 [Nocardia camponoti]
MWTHPQWQPRPATPADRLRDYASHCGAVEGNTTFYATPSSATVATWAASTAPDFRFVLKVPKPLSHERRLVDIEAELLSFLDTMSPLGSRVHALWLQLPASFGPTDLGALARFQRLLPSGLRCAVEVRHPAFFRDDTAATQLERVLGRIDAEWVPFDTTVLFDGPPTDPSENEARAKKPRLPRRMRALGEFPIVRYHGRADDARTVAGWQPWLDVVANWLVEGRSPTVFIHTPDNAAARGLARQFHDEVRALVPELPPQPTPIDHAPMTLF